MVSIIIPCYNAEKYIERCLDSVLNQSDKDIELIIVNDGSTDQSETIILHKKEELEEELSRVVYLKQNNKGVGAACNLGFKYVTGEYLLLLDSDDALMTESIQAQAEWLDAHRDYDIVRTNGYYVEEENCTIKNSLEVISDRAQHLPLFEELFDGMTYLWPGTYMLRMSALDKIYPEREIYPSRSGQNLQFLMMTSYYCKDGFIDKKLMKYTVRSESLSHFTGNDALRKEIDAMLGYKDIRQYLVNKFMTGEEKLYWNWRLELLYAKVFVRLGAKYNDKKLMKKYYYNVKNILGKKQDLDFAIEYYHVMNPLLYYFFRILRKIKTIMKSVD